MNTVIKDIVTFFRGHWPHVIIAIPAAVAFTSLHELAHCVAVWVQGGSVTEFVWLPSGSEWGHMRYCFPPGVSYNSIAVSLSPYVFWALFCLVAGILSLRRRRWPFWFASTLFVWLFIVPLADIANTALPYLAFGSDNDFRHAFGPPRPAFALAAGICGVVAAVYGYLLNQRLYRDRAVGIFAYCVLALTALLALGAVTIGRWI
jgi:hypothetical protein